MMSTRDYTPHRSTLDSVVPKGVSPSTTLLTTPLINTHDTGIGNTIACPRTFGVSSSVIAFSCELKTMLLDRPLILRQTPGAYIMCASSFLAVETSGEPAAMDNRPIGIAKKAKVRTSRHQETYAGGVTSCAGVVYGCTLASLVHYCRVRGARTAQIMRCITAVMAPVAHALKHVDGVDLHTLCAGLASRRMLRTQAERMGALSHADVYGTSRASASAPSRNGVNHPRFGNQSTVIGATATLFCIYRLLSTPMMGDVLISELITEAAFFCRTNSLERAICCLIADGGVLDQATPLVGVETSIEWERSAMEVERRALARALAAVQAATRYAEIGSLNCRQTMDTALSWYARAAWPAGEVVNERTHVALLERMRGPGYYTGTMSLAVVTPARTAPAVVPLSQLGCVIARGRTSTDGEESSYTTRSSCSRSNPSSGSASVTFDAACSLPGVSGLQL